MAVPVSREAVDRTARPFTLSSIRPSRDILASIALLALATLGAWVGPRLSGGVPRGDSYLQFIPWYTFLGEQLRAGNIPGWNPHQFSGAPFAGDPQSGWMYLPSMGFFALFPSVPAYTFFALFHIAFAGLTAYALGRVHGFTVLAALTTGITYMFSPFVEGVSCCSVRTQVASWLPLAILGVELALRSGNWLSRAGWWSISGIAISQMLGGWLGQGAYYGLLTIGAYLFFRAVISPPEGIQTLRARVTALIGHGAAILLLGFGLGAAGVWPRIDAVSRSNLAGGEYQGNAADMAETDGWHLMHAIDRIMTEDDNQRRWYLAGAVFVLAVVAPLIAHRRSLIIFWAVFTAVSVVLPLNPTPLHDVLYAVLPRFETLHQHVSSRSLLMIFLGPALMAGATVDAIARRRRGAPLPLSIMLLGPLLFLMAAYLLVTERREVGSITFFGVFTVASVLGVAVVLSDAWAFRHRLARIATTAVVPALLALLVFWDPTGSQILGVVREDGTSIPRTPVNLRELSCIGGPTPAAEFLQEQQATGPWRYFGNDFAYLGFHDGEWEAYRHNLKYRDVQRLLVVNQALCLDRLHDLQGYNPVQSARYTEFLAAMNGRTQEYHESNVLQGGFTSPLLDALNARFIVIPAEVNPGRPDLLHLSQRLATVYSDDRVRILENPGALPRAWLVHAAEQVPPGGAIPTLQSGQVDLATTAVLERAQPDLAEPNDPATDTVTVQSYAPDAIDLTAQSDAPGLVVLSEVYDPDWHAYVDGVAAPVLVANHALRAVPVPAGEHTIELRYESRPLRNGLLISGITILIVASVGIALAMRTMRRNRAP